MKSIIFFSLCFTLCGYAQASIVLEYRCSDSVYQSKLTIDHRGHVELGESCFDACSDHTYDASYQLSPEDLLKMSEAIAGLQAQAQVTKQVKYNQSMCQGVLKVFRGKEEILVREVDHRDFATSLSGNTSRSAEFLARLPIDFVKMKMQAFP